MNKIINGQIYTDEQLSNNATIFDNHNSCQQNVCQNSIGNINDISCIDDVSYLDDINDINDVNNEDCSFIDTSNNMQSDRLVTICLQEMTYLAVMFFNDLWFLHHRVKGDLFFPLHEELDKAYNEMKDQVDWFDEHADSADDVPVNYNDISSAPISKYWNSIHVEGNINWRNVLAYLMRNGNDYIEALRICRESMPNFIQSKIDEYTDYWQTFINYKVKHTLEGSNDNSLITIG